MSAVGIRYAFQAIPQGRGQAKSHDEDSMVSMGCLDLGQVLSQHNLATALGAFSQRGTQLPTQPAPSPRNLRDGALAIRFTDDTLLQSLWYDGAGVDIFLHVNDNFRLSEALLSCIMVV